jgi:superfamily II DNA or RNA helicase
MNYLNELRPKQIEIMNKVIGVFNETRGGLIIVGCGVGKTNMAIYLACHYKLKTLFLVHKDFLKRQATMRILDNTNIREVGIIQGSKINIDAPFVIGMVQSISQKDYDPAIFKDFGLIIIDEVHHMGAKVFSRFFDKVPAKYMLGISAENERNDGAFKIINYYMGPIIHYEDQIPNDKVIVKRIMYDTSNYRRTRIVINRATNEPDRSKMITNLYHIKRRNRLIMMLFSILFDLGKKILFLTGRLRQIDILTRLINNNEKLGGHSGKYIGGMKDAELNISSQKRIIMGTYEMAQEGLDIDDLTVLILGTPKGVVKQPVGRILRKAEYDYHPLVFDIVDVNNKIFSNQSIKRLKYYYKQKYSVHTCNVTDRGLEGNINWNDEAKIKKFILKEKRKQQPEVAPNDYGNIEFLED